MAKDKKVEQITDMEVDFAQWFTDVCKKAQLIDYSSIKGVFIYRPYGYAIWENIQNIMDKESFTCACTPTPATHNNSTITNRFISISFTSATPSYNSMSV